MQYLPPPLHFCTHTKKREEDQELWKSSPIQWAWAVMGRHFLTAGGGRQAGLPVPMPATYLPCALYLL